MMTTTDDPLILVLDVGSTSIRGLIFDRHGQVLPGIRSRCPIGLAVETNGASESDLDQLLERILACLDDLMVLVKKISGDIIAVGVCTFVSNVVGLDENGRPLTGLLTYADTRAASQAAALKQRLDQKRFHQRTGCIFHPSYLTAQLAHLAESRPEVFNRVIRWVSLGEYLELTLFGHTEVSFSIASWTGLLDHTRLDWDEELLDFLNLRPDQFSPLTDFNRPRYGLKPAFSIRWPALASAAWFPAVGDGAAANIGSQCIGPKRVALTMGTSSAVRMIPAEPPRKIPEGLFCYRVDGNRSLLGGALTEGGGLFQWFVDTLRIESTEQAEMKVGSMAPDSHGITMLPFWAGERSPGWAGEAKGGIVGMSLATKPEEILRAAMEAVALRLAEIHRLLIPYLDPDHMVIASGGALTGSPTWLEIIADVLGRPVGVPNTEEATARGISWLILEAMGEINDLTTIESSLTRVQQPNNDHHLMYKRAGQRQKDLYRRLIIDGKGVAYHN